MFELNYFVFKLGCCGINSYKDWKDLSKNHTLPDSCCSYYDDYYNGYNNNNENKEPRCVPYHMGCARKLYYVINTCAIVLASGTIAICIFQVRILC